MAYNIRPLSFAEVLDRAFRVYVDNFQLLVGIAAVVWIPYGVMVAAGPVFASVAFILLLLAAPIMAVAHAIAVAHVYLDRPITIQDAYGATRPILLRIVGTYLLFYLLVMLAFLALIVPGIYFVICWSLMLPVMVVEQRFGMSALSRSRGLVTGTWWATFGILLVAGLLVSLPATALQLVWGFIPFFGPMLNAATQAVTSTYSAVVLVVYYFDRRCRVEDFDLRLLAEQIRAAGGAASPDAQVGVNPVA